MTGEVASFLESYQPNMSEADAEYLVFGFISEIELKLSSNIIIPAALKKLCFDYYYICELFADHGDNIQLNETNDIAWYIPNAVGKNTIYGFQIIDPSNRRIKIYKWTLKILGFENRNGFYFGKDSSDKQSLNGDFTFGRNKKPFYAFL